MSLRKFPRDIALFPDFIKAYPSCIKRLQSASDPLSRIYHFEIEMNISLLEIDGVEDPYFNMLLEIQKGEIYFNKKAYRKALDFFKPIEGTLQKIPCYRTLYFRCLVGMIESYWRKRDQSQAIIYLQRAQNLLSKIFHVPSLKRYYAQLYLINKEAGHIKDATKAFNLIKYYTN